MSEKVIVTLRSTPAASVDVPDVFPRDRKSGAEPESIERSCFGAVRIFPGVPKIVSKAELRYIQKYRPDVGTRLDVRPYVESKRLDYRGATEEEISKISTAEGVSHLRFGEQVKVLLERGKLTPGKSTETIISSKSSTSDDSKFRKVGKSRRSG